MAGRRIGWIGDWGGHYPLEDGILALCEAGLGVLGELGAVVEPVAPAFDADRLWVAWLVLRGFAMAARLGEMAADPQKRGRLKPEAVWEVESGSGSAPTRCWRRAPSARSGSPARLRSSSGSTCWRCRARRFSVRRRVDLAA